MNRNAWTVRACLGLVCLGFWVSGSVAAERPNVLFIAVDDLNDWIGSLGGHPQAKTPHLDRLAAGGTVFLNAHCQAPLCNPSRTSAMTGLRPSTTGIYALEPWFRTCEPLKNWVTLPQYFEKHGYRTLSTGKIYHDGLPPGTHVNGQEFMVWGFNGSHGPRPPKKFVETPDSLWLIDWGAYPQSDDQLDDWKVTDWAIAQLKAAAGSRGGTGSAPAGRRPFFLGVGLRRPHLPCYVPQKWFDLYPDDTLVLPPYRSDDLEDIPPFAAYLHWRLPEPTRAWLEQQRQYRMLVRSYLACTSFMDSQVGRLMTALRETGLADNTVVVLWGDNGWHVGEKGMTGKTTLWERSTRVPMIWSGPGVTAGGRCTQPAELLDMYPTLIELCGLPARDGLEGHSLVPQLKDAKAARSWPAITTHGPNNHAVRSEQWRYIRYADGSEELYDMSKDRNEWTNLAADPARADVKRELSAFLPKVNTPPAAGSKSRLVELRDGKVYWENKAIEPSLRPE